MPVTNDLGRGPWLQSENTAGRHLDVILSRRAATLCQTADLRNRKLINGSCFKPVSLWCFVTRQWKTNIGSEGQVAATKIPSCYQKSFNDRNSRSTVLRESQGCCHHQGLEGCKSGDPEHSPIRLTFWAPEGSRWILKTARRPCEFHQLVPPVAPVSPGVGSLL